MAKQQKPSDVTVVALKGARFLTYIVYIYAIVATVFLTIGSILLLFGANPNVGFTKFVYNIAEAFLAPFRGMFPPKQVSESGYFSASAFFAIIIYLLVALAISSLIAFLTAKLVQHEKELEELQA